MVSSAKSKIALGQLIVSADSVTDKRDEDNFYPTPTPFIDWLIRWCDKNEDVSGTRDVSRKILDVGVGTGNWGKAYTDAGFDRIMGIEKNTRRFMTMPNHWDDYWHIHSGDLMQTTLSDFGMPKTGIRLIVSNPPYQKGVKGKTSTADMVTYMLRNLLHKEGTLICLLPSNFAHTIDRWQKFFHADEEERTSIMPYAVINLANRINFYTEDGKGGSYPGEYSVYFWRPSMKSENFYRTYTERWE